MRIQKNAAPLRLWLIDAVPNRDRSTCWLPGDYPPANMHHKGYPRVGDEKAMHVALILDGRPRPPAPMNHCLHTCDVAACVNPDHLYWGSASDNQRDRAARQNESFLRGSANGFAKLTEEQVVEIRRLYATGLYGQRTLAKMFGVTKYPIQRIVRGNGWLHVH